jgi:hypothetical protein
MPKKTLRRHWMRLYCENWWQFAGGSLPAIALDSNQHSKGKSRPLKQGLRSTRQVIKALTCAIFSASSSSHMHCTSPNTNSSCCCLGRAAAPAPAAAASACRSVSSASSRITVPGCTLWLPTCAVLYSWRPALLLEDPTQLTCGHSSTGTHSNTTVPVQPHAGSAL